MDLETRILKLTWTRRYSLDGLRRALGMPHDDLLVLVFAVKALLEAGKLRLWGGSERPGETLYIAA
jgi:hypothetical protein